MQYYNAVSSDREKGIEGTKGSCLRSYDGRETKHKVIESPFKAQYTLTRRLPHGQLHAAKKGFKFPLLISAWNMKNITRSFLRSPVLVSPSSDSLDGGREG